MASFADTDACLPFFAGGGASLSEDELSEELLPLPEEDEESESELEASESDELSAEGINMLRHRLQAERPGMHMHTQADRSGDWAPWFREN